MITSYYLSLPLKGVPPGHYGMTGWNLDTQFRGILLASKRRCTNIRSNMTTTFTSVSLSSVFLWLEMFFFEQPLIHQYCLFFYLFNFTLYQAAAGVGCVWSVR
ncbi:hypothetical protein MCOR04_004535 [Pyricularia oryzae]|nr:hypothetical protein MCOR04_004535 [Pyricularia oryzae]